jgi:hypothetical protein
MYLALTELIIGAFFFACRSCEYLRVTVRGRTKILCLANIRFTSHTYEEIHHSDNNLLQKAHFVSVTFEEQKNNHKQETRTQTKNDDPILCPGKSWVRIVQRINSYRNQLPQSTVNTYWKKEDKTFLYFSQKAANTYLKYTVNKKTQTILDTAAPP